MIKLLLFDVDGVLTDGTIWMDGSGEVLKGFHVQDGLAVALLRAHGVRCGVLSGKSSAALDARIAQLGFDVAVTGHLGKRDALDSIIADQEVSLDEVAYVGDDVVDLPLAGEVATFYAPRDAHQLVLSAADVVLSSRGGRGAAREAAEHLLSARGMSLKAMYTPLIAQMGSTDVVQ